MSRKLDRKYRKGAAVRRPLRYVVVGNNIIRHDILVERLVSIVGRHETAQVLEREGLV